MKSLLVCAAALLGMGALGQNGQRQENKGSDSGGIINVPGSSPVIRYVAGSTIKVEQLLGEEDKERHQPTLSRTVTRYGIEGTDLGYSFEHDGRAYFLIGDTVGRLRRALDTIATTEALDAESGVRLDFLTMGSDYLTIQPPGISVGAFEVPVSGLASQDRCTLWSAQTIPRTAPPTAPY